MAWHEGILDFGRVNLNARHVWNRATAILAARAGSSAAAPLAQQGNQLLLKLIPGRGIDGVVDRLVRDVLTGVPTHAQGVGRLGMPDDMLEHINPHCLEVLGR